MNVFYFHPYIFSEDIKMPKSSEAMTHVNTELLRYFDPCQLVVSRAAALLAFTSAHLRGEYYDLTLLFSHL